MRNAVWDHLHGYPPSPPDDIDVIWFAPDQPDPDHDAAAERQLCEHAPGLPWSVRNQARMHARNGDAPYRSCADAMMKWPETATAIAVRLDVGGTLEILAPLGMADLLGLVLRPTPHAARHQPGLFESRIAAKRWRQRWPGLRLMPPEPQPG